jgi:hypothetical protein
MRQSNDVDAKFHENRSFHSRDIRGRDGTYANMTTQQIVFPLQRKADEKERE